ncbi:MAG: hypothetical protein WEE20_05170, partial [Bacteroidota bacterium]
KPLIASRDQSRRPTGFLGDWLTAKSHTNSNLDKKWKNSNENIPREILEDDLHGKATIVVYDPSV